MKPRFFPFRAISAPDVGIDLGTTHTIVCVAGEGIVLREPSLVAVEQGSGRVLHGGRAVGELARIMHGRTPDSIQIVRPIHAGAIADFGVASAMLRALLARTRRGGWTRPRALVAAPCGMTPVERQAVRTTLARVGIRQVCLVAKPKAAALGAGLPLTEPVASMVCDIGGGTSEIAVLCLGDLAVTESLRVAGDAMDRAIADYLRRREGLRIGAQMAERLKIEIGSAAPLDAELQIEVRGGDVTTGLPRKAVLTSEAVRESLEGPVQMIVEAVQRTLERCHPELCADLMQNGAVLAGGTAALRGLDRRLAQATGMPVRVSDEPAFCVARGLGICLDHLDAWHAMLEPTRAA
jgi:rod shape-determining protein MreB